MLFREDILRGVRLFLIAFAAILIGVWAYRMLHTPDVQGAPELEAPAAPVAQDAAQPAQDPGPDAAPVAETAPETHGLTVPPPPPVGGTHVTPVGGTHVSKVARPKMVIPAPPPAPMVARARPAPAPSGRAFEVPETGVLPAARTEESADASPAAPKKGVGYKSLLEADPNPAPEPSFSASGDDPVEKPKGNRFLKAVGKIFHPGKKETTPLTVQPKQ